MRCRQARDHRHCRQHLANREQCFQPLAKDHHGTRPSESDAMTKQIPHCAARKGDRGLSACGIEPGTMDRAEEHTSELQSLMRSSYAVFCLRKKIAAKE